MTAVVRQRETRVRRWSIGAIAALAVLAAGCFRVDSAITVHQDGTGTVSTLFAVDDRVMGAFVQMSGGNPFTALQPSDLPSGGTIQQYKQTGFTGMRVTVPFAGTDDTGDIGDEVQHALGTDDAGPLPSPIDDFLLRREGDDWRLRAHLVEGSTFAGQDLGAANAREMLANATFTVRVTLPGYVVKHNADEVRGRELIWHIDLTAKGDRTLEATTEMAGIPGLPSVGLVWLFSLLGGAILLTAGAAVQVWRLTLPSPSSGRGF